MPGPVAGMTRLTCAWKARNKRVVSPRVRIHAERKSMKIPGGFSCLLASPTLQSKPWPAWCVCARTKREPTQIRYVCTTNGITNRMVSLQGAPQSLEMEAPRFHRMTRLQEGAGRTRHNLRVGLSSTLGETPIRVHPLPGRKVPRGPSWTYALLNRMSRDPSGLLGELSEFRS